MVGDLQKPKWFRQLKQFMISLFGASTYIYVKDLDFHQTRYKQLQIDVMITNETSNFEIRISGPIICPPDEC